MWAAARPHLDLPALAEPALPDLSEEAWARVLGPFLAKAPAQELARARVYALAKPAADFREGYWDRRELAAAERLGSVDWDLEPESVSLVTAVQLPA